MLTIRREHLSAFRQAADRDFCLRLCSYLRRHHSAATSRYDDDLLGRMVTAGIARARRHGLSFESNIAFFVTLMFEFAPNFDEHPRIQQILAERKRAREESLEAIVEGVSEEDWAEIEQRSDRSAWQI